MAPHYRDRGHQRAGQGAGLDESLGRDHPTQASQHHRGGWRVSRGSLPL